MKASYESERNQESIIYIKMAKLNNKKEWCKSISIARKLETYGYEMCHVEQGEYIMICGDTDLTITQMREDYSIAKKEAA